MPISIISQPPNDSFSFRLFYKLVKDYADEADIIYLWSLMLDPKWESVKWSPVFEKFLPVSELHYRKLIKKLIKKDIVILCIKDHLTSGDSYNTIPKTVEYVSSMTEFYSDKKIILFTSVENLEAYLNFPNLYIIPIGGDITNQQSEYQTLSPVIDKNLNSSTLFLSLNRLQRLHRTLILSTIYGLDLNEKGLISCMFQKDLDKNFHEIQSTGVEYLTNGFNKLKNNNFKINDNEQIYPFKGNDNVFNFKYKLSNYYKNTFVEIVGETSYFEKCFLLTEKTLNCFYGCNFPIILCSQGSINFLRNLGVDMFDDIIDHSYDNEPDPVKKIYSALKSNERLLTDEHYTKNLWALNKDRFLKNIEFFKKDIYLYYESRATDEFFKIRDKIWN